MNRRQSESSTNGDGTFRTGDETGKKREAKHQGNVASKSKSTRVGSSTGTSSESSSPEPSSTETSAGTSSNAASNTARSEANNGVNSMGANNNPGDVGGGPEPPVGNRPADKSTQQGGGRGKNKSSWNLPRKYIRWRKLSDNLEKQPVVHSSEAEASNVTSLPKLCPPNSAQGACPTDVQHSSSIQQNQSINKAHQMPSSLHEQPQNDARQETEEASATREGSNFQSRQFSEPKRWEPVRSQQECLTRFPQISSVRNLVGHESSKKVPLLPIPTASCTLCEQGNAPQDNQGAIHATLPILSRDEDVSRVELTHVAQVSYPHGCIGDGRPKNVSRRLNPVYVSEEPKEQTSQTQRTSQRKIREWNLSEAQRETSNDIIHSPQIRTSFGAESNPAQSHPASSSQHPTQMHTIEGTRVNLRSPQRTMLYRGSQQGYEQTYSTYAQGACSVGAEQWESGRNIRHDNDHASLVCQPSLAIGSQNPNQLQHPDTGLPVQFSQHPQQWRTEDDEAKESYEGRQYSNVRHWDNLASYSNSQNLSHVNPDAAQTRSLPSGGGARPKEKNKHFGFSQSQSSLNRGSSSNAVSYPMYGQDVQQPNTVRNTALPQIGIQHISPTPGQQRRPPNTGHQPPPDFPREMEAARCARALRENDISVHWPPNRNQSCTCRYRPNEKPGTSQHTCTGGARPKDKFRYLQNPVIQSIMPIPRNAPAGQIISQQGAPPAETRRESVPRNSNARPLTLPDIVQQDANLRTVRQGGHRDTSAYNPENALQLYPRVNEYNCSLPPIPPPRQRSNGRARPKDSSRHPRNWENPHESFKEMQKLAICVAPSRKNRRGRRRYENYQRLYDFLCTIIQNALTLILAMIKAQDPRAPFHSMASQLSQNEPSHQGVLRPYQRCGRNNKRFSQQRVSAPFQRGSTPTPSVLEQFQNVLEQFQSVSEPFQNISAQFQNISAQFQNVSAQFQNVSEPFQSIAPHQSVSEQFQSVSAQFQSLSAQFQNVSAQFQNVSEPFQNVSEPFQNVSEPFQNISAPFQNISEPFQNVSEPFQDVSAPFQNISEPFQNVSEPFQDVSAPFHVSEPFQNVSEPFQNVSEQFQNVSEPFQNASAPFLNVSAPFQSVSAQFQNVSEPFERISAPFQNVSAPFLNVSAPFQSVSAQFQNVSEPFERISAPFQNVSAQFQGISAPHQGVSVPFQDVSAQFQNVSAPFQNVSAPFQNVSAQFQNVSAPFQNVSAPFQNVSAQFQNVSAPFQNVSAPFQNVSAPFQSISAPHQRFAAPFRSIAPHQRVSAQFQNVSAQFQNVSAPFQNVSAPFQSISAPHQRVSAAFQNVSAQFQTMSAPYQRSLSPSQHYGQLFQRPWPPYLPPPPLVYWTQPVQLTAAQLQRNAQVFRLGAPSAPPHQRAAAQYYGHTLPYIQQIAPSLELIVVPQGSTALPSNEFAQYAFYSTEEFVAHMLRTIWPFLQGATSDEPLLALQDMGGPAQGLLSPQAQAREDTVNIIGGMQLVSGDHFTPPPYVPTTRILMASYLPHHNPLSMDTMYLYVRLQNMNTRGTLVPNSRMAPAIGNDLDSMRILVTRSPRLTTLGAPLITCADVSPNQQYSAGQGRGYEENVLMIIRYPRSYETLRIVSLRQYIEYSDMTNIRTMTETYESTVTKVLSDLVRQEGKTRAVRTLLAAGTSANSLDSHAIPPIMYSTSADVTEALLDYGASANTECDLESSSGRTPLLRAARRQDEDTLRLLLSRDANPHQADAHGYTPLMFAVMHGISDRSLEDILNAGVDVNARNELGETALHLAMHRRGRRSTLRLLVSRGAIVNLPNNAGKTPLMEAAQSMSIRSIRFLIRRGADVNIADPRHDNALTLAIHCRNRVRSLCEILSLLASTHTVNAMSGDGRTPLMLCALRKRTCQQLAMRLIELGADANLVTQSGSQRRTALSVAFNQFRLNCFRQGAMAYVLYLLYISDEMPILGNFRPLVHYLMMKTSCHAVRYAIEKGAAPLDVSIRELENLLGSPFMHSCHRRTISPLFLAIYIGSEILVKYFIHIRFYTVSDLETLRNDRCLERKVKQLRHSRYLYMVRRALPRGGLETMALTQLSRNIGEGSERLRNIESLRLPWLFNLYLMYLLPLNLHQDAMEAEPDLSQRPPIFDRGDYHLLRVSTIHPVLTCHCLSLPYRRRDEIGERIDAIEARREYSDIGPLMWPPLDKFTIRFDADTESEATNDSVSDANDRSSDEEVAENVRIVEVGAAAALGIENIDPVNYRVRRTDRAALRHSDDDEDIIIELDVTGAGENDEDIYDDLDSLQDTTDTGSVESVDSSDTGDDIRRDHKKHQQGKRDAAVDASVYNVSDENDNSCRERVADERDKNDAISADPNTSAQGKDSQRDQEPASGGLDGHNQIFRDLGVTSSEENGAKSDKLLTNGRRKNDGTSSKDQTASSEEDKDQRTGSSMTLRENNEMVERKKAEPNQTSSDESGNSSDVESAEDA